MIGGVIGNFKIIEQIGEGGMGTVYRGVDLMLDRPVALKRLRPDFSDNPQLLERFRSEATALARLNHPHIATLYSFFRHQDDHFMAMEFVEGETLDEILRKGGPIPAQRAIGIFDQVLDAIEHAHQLNVLHRDIKPENIIVSKQDVAKVTDFGIARVLGEAGLTRAGALIGTVAYMAPERVKGEPADRRSDIYSLGVVLYEILAGRGPFAAASEFELMTAHVEKAPTPLARIVPGIPGPVAGCVMQALAKSPDERPPSAAAFRRSLNDAMCTHGHTPVRWQPARVSSGGISETRFSPPEVPAHSLPPLAGGSPGQRAGIENSLDWQTYAAIASAAFLIGVVVLILFKYLT